MYNHVLQMETLDDGCCLMINVAGAAGVSRDMQIMFPFPSNHAFLLSITLCSYASAPALLHYAPMPQPQPYYTMLLCLSPSPIILCSYTSAPALLYYAPIPQPLPYYTMLLCLSPSPIILCSNTSAPALLHYAPMPQPLPYYTMLLCLSPSPIILCSYASASALLRYAPMHQPQPYYAQSKYVLVSQKLVIRTFINKINISVCYIAV